MRVRVVWQTLIARGSIRVPDSSGITQNGGFGLNTSVLSRTPRDCTAWSYTDPDGCTVPACVSGLPHKTHFPSMMPTKAQRRAAAAAQRAAAVPKGSSPFSAPQLFAGQPRRQRNPSGNGRVQAPVANTRVMAGGSVARRGDSTTIVRREYVGDIAGSVAFATTSYTCNPGVSGLFAWLPAIANSYEQYAFTSVKFLYEPEAATSATGAVILSFDYDVLDTAPSTKQESLLVKDSVRSAPWAASQLVLPRVELDRRGNLYVRSGAVSNSDLKTYDLGRLNVSTAGQAGTTTVGELWVEYTVRLMIAQQSTTTGGASSAAKIVASTGVSRSAIYGSAATVTGTLAVTASSNTLTFPSVGQYLVTQEFVGTGITTANTAPTLTGTATSTNVTITVSTLTGQTTDSTHIFAYFTVNCTAASQTLIADWSGTASTITNTVVRIAGYPTSLA